MMGWRDKMERGIYKIMLNISECDFKLLLLISVKGLYRKARITQFREQ